MRTQLQVRGILIVAATYLTFSGVNMAAPLTACNKGKQRVVKVHEERK
jgi:hypothetical protein